jgi:uncharacterized membrane protein YdjX (TVP38/TMEM64 family)
VDPGGTYQPHTEKSFGPYHDIQMIVAGPIVRPLAELARMRWKQATGETPLPPLPAISAFDCSPSLPPSWPENTAVDFYQVEMAAALTMPPGYGRTPMRQVEQLYLDMIQRAQNFIYMENQFFCSQTIAEALNRRLQEVPELRVLLVSCYNPEGIMERKSMWHGRVHFRDTLESNGVGKRVTLTYPASVENGHEKPVRIHSKVMIVDDTYLRVGSSNINNRSMGFDTECDLVIEAHNEEARHKIASIRNDLIREHTGRELASIERIIKHGSSVEKLLNHIPHSRQHLRRIDDEIYRYERFSTLATRIADPHSQLLPELFAMPPFIRHTMRYIPMRLVISIALITAFVLSWQVTPLAEIANPEKMGEWFRGARGEFWFIPLVLGAFILSGIIFFPLTVLIAATAIALPTAVSFPVAIIGSLAGAAIGFLLGRKMGINWLRKITGRYADKIGRYAKRGGIASVAALRMLPVAPYTVVNFGLGMSEISFTTYLAGTLLGLLPGIIAFSFMGKSLASLWENPNAENITWMVVAIVFYLGILAVTHYLAKHWQDNKPATDEKKSLDATPLNQQAMSKG